MLLLLILQIFTAQEFLITPESFISESSYFGYPQHRNRTALNSARLSENWGGIAHSLYLKTRMPSSLPGITATSSRTTMSKKQKNDLIKQKT